MQIVKFADFKRDIGHILEIPIVREQVRDEENQYGTINVTKAMRQLSSVAPLLGIAYAGTKGFHSNAQVVELLSNYQTLGKNSEMACNDFLRTSMKALELHKKAFELVDNNNSDKAMKVLGRISKNAGKMVDVSSKLVEKSDMMIQQANAALKETANDNTIASNKKGEIIKMITDLNAKQMELESKRDALKQQVQDAQLQEREAIQAADAYRNRAFILSLVSKMAKPLLLLPLAKGVGGSLVALFSTLGKDDKEGNSWNASQFDIILNALLQKKRDLTEAQDKLNESTTDDEMEELEENIAQYKSEIEQLEAELIKAKQFAQQQAESVSTREARYHEERMKLQELEREVNADLIASVTKLNGTTQQNDTLFQAIASLEVAIKALGKVKTAFEDTRSYWYTVQKHCETLADSDQFEDMVDMKDQLIEAITTSWYSWLALGKINYTAVCAIGRVIENVDAIMNDLPTSEEAKVRLPEMIASIKRQLSDEQANF